MGMYTELVFGARLKENTPKHIIEILKVMFRLQERLPRKYEDRENEFPETGRIPFGGSYYFAVQNSHSTMYYDDISKDWTIVIRCNIKNYHNQIENFVEWITPYCRGSGRNDDFLGYKMYEEDDVPTMIWLPKKVSK